MDQLDLSKLGRRELLAMLLEVTKEKELLQEKVEQLQVQVDSKEIRLNSCGTLAEAALQINNVFAQADLAAAQYLENVKALQDEQLKIKLEAETNLLFTQQRCFELEENTKQRCAQLEEETAVKCSEMVAKANKEADDYQQSVMERINHLRVEYENAFSIFKTIQSSFPSMTSGDSNE